MNRHTFVICAYKESPYLEECVKSVKNQTVPSDLIMATSTSCDHIKEICERYGIRLYVNQGKTGITQDWNFAYEKCETPYITIAHQDDIYFPNYTEQIMKQAERAGKALLLFSDYYEIRNGEYVKSNLLLKVKRIMLFPLRGKVFQKSRFIRRRILSLGSPICCPSVTFCRDNLPRPIFHDHFRSNGDWEAWERISRLKGEFIYCPQPLMAHRIHADSATTAIIGDKSRTQEDMEMFCKFWPKGIAGFINWIYRRCEHSNEI